MMSEFNFVHDTTAFNLQNAYSLAMVADLSYRNEAEIEEKVKNVWGFQAFRFFDNPDEGTQGFAMTNDNIIVVAFRGTEPDQIEDWITDLNIELVDGPLDGEVHDGFYTSLKSVWQKVERTIAGFRANKPKSLWFTGHSLGAALAGLAVARLLDEDRPVDGLYTFGQPRFGDKRFARNFNLDFKPYAFRFVNNNDIVTRIPPRSLDYRHVGMFKYFTEDGRLVDDISCWNRFLDRMRGRIEDILEWGSDGIKDHSMGEYLRLLKNALQSE